MKILFLHLSDLHIKNKADLSLFEVDQMVSALRGIEDVDKRVIVISGDITQSGEANQYKIAGAFLGNLVRKIKTECKDGKWIEVLVSPGNHDLNFSSCSRSFEDIKNAYREDKIEELFYKEESAFTYFYDFARFNNCFRDNPFFSTRKIEDQGEKINIALLNSAPFSLLGSSNEDKGVHYLGIAEVNKIKKFKASELNIFIMHHSLEWFSDNIKKTLRKEIAEKFTLMFTGHEHDSIGEKRKFNNKDCIISFQGCSLSGDRIHEKGFGGVILDTKIRKLKGYSFIWEKDHYRPRVIADEAIPDKRELGILSHHEEFLTTIKYDENKKLIKDYFVCPTMQYNMIDENGDLKVDDIEEIEDFEKLFEKHQVIIVSGDKKSGRSTLAKLIYQFVIKKGQVPLLLNRDNLQSKKFDRVIRFAFAEQYSEEEQYSKFQQINPKEKVLLIDDGDKIEKYDLEKLIKSVKSEFGTLIILKENKINFDLHKQVRDALDENNCCYINIKPFLYDKRKRLIANVYYLCKQEKGTEKNDDEIEKMNKLINNQVKYFRLDPGFIINFVHQYTSKFNFNGESGSDIFSMVYENSIKTRLIEQVKEIEVGGIFSALQELAFYMHFNKMTTISLEKLVEVVTIYNAEYKQKVNWSSLLNGATRAGILCEEECTIQFKDKNLLAYFVAQALNKKYYDDEDEIGEKLEYLLNNICFSINSDIILFMALIMNNPRIIKCIMKKAEEHFCNKSELSFDENNLPYLLKSDFKVKKTLPTPQEKKANEKKITSYEQEIKESEVIKLIDEYDYDEEEIISFQNQLLISLKYLEILSKILPSFSHNMKGKQQEKLIEAIYTFPNRFLYDILKDIYDDYQKFVDEIYDEMSQLKKEKELVELGVEKDENNIIQEEIEKIERITEQVSIMFIISVYQMISSLASNSITIDGLNEFPYKENTNYRIMNLMMVEKTNKIEEYCKKAVKFYEDTDIKLVKSMIRLSVRNYLLNHEVKVVGGVQRMLDKFYGTSERGSVERKNVKYQLAKNKLVNK